MRFTKGDYIHTKGTKSWFLNPPARVARVTKGGYYIAYDAADMSFDISHSRARQYEVVWRVEKNS